MKPTNPLFPNSDSDSIQAAYEQAALMDDETQTYNQKNTPKNTPFIIKNKSSVTLLKDGQAVDRKTFYRFYTDYMKDLRKQYHEDKISKVQFKQERTAVKNILATATHQQLYLIPKQV